MIHTKRSKEYKRWESPDQRSMITDWPAGNTVHLIGIRYCGTQWCKPNSNNLCSNRSRNGSRQRKPDISHPRWLLPSWSRTLRPSSWTLSNGNFSTPSTCTAGRKRFNRFGIYLRFYPGVANYGIAINGSDFDIERGFGRFKTLERHTWAQHGKQVDESFLV